MKKTFLFFVFCFLFFRSAFAASYDPSLKWRTIKTDHFNVHFDASLEAQAQKAAQYLEEAHAKLSPKFGWVPWGRTEVIVTDNNDIANGLTSTLPYNWILLRVASPDPDSILSDYDNWLRTLAFHEYTHILHIDQYGGVVTLPRYILGKIVSPNGTVPGFIREGIATYIETTETSAGRGKAVYSDMILRTAILENKFPKIDEVDGVGWRWPSYQSMYIYGVKFMQYLSDKYGEDKLMEFHKKMGRTPFLYCVNHQARKIFNNIQFQPKRVHTRYERVRKEGTQRSKTFYNLWNEWKASLEKQYVGDKARIEAEGLTEFERVASGETTLSSPAVSPDGKYLAYARARVKGPAELHLLDLQGGVNKIIKKRQLATHISFSPDSKKIAYSAVGAFKTYNSFSDIYLYDIETKKVEQLTHGARASDPAFSPDGKKIIFVRQNGGASWLAIYDVETKEIRDLNNPPIPLGVRPHHANAGEDILRSGTPTKGSDPIKGGSGGFVQFAQPAWSPDGKRIAVLSWQPFARSYETGQWDIYLLQISKFKIQNSNEQKQTGEKIQISNIRKLTDDHAIDSRPVWSEDGKAIYYASDKSGINNIYRMGSAVGSDPIRITNVLTGVSQPAISPDGKTLYVQYYNGEGFDIRKTDVGSTKYEVRDRRQEARSGNNPTTPPFSLLPPAKTLAVREADELQFKTKKYSPFGKSLFLPRFIIPNIATIDDGVMMGVFTGGTDPLRRHNWLGGATYRTDLSSYIGYYFNYWYSRYKPVFSAGIVGYAVNFGDLTFLHADGTTNTVHLYEGRRRIHGGVSYPWKKQSFGLQYFWEDRDSETSLSADEKAALNLGNFAGFSISYAYGQVEKYPASISYEHGRRLRMNLSITDKTLGSGSRNEQRIFAGDYREYINLPWANHVLALRTSGGMVWGDTLVQGTFSLGGALGEGLMGGGDSLYYFPLRGLPVASLSRTRAMLLSGEYRLPLVSPQRGFGTFPFFIQNIHLAPFADYGNAWNADTDTGEYFFDNFFLGTGLEVRGDFVIGHGLPISGRIGYGIIVVNRDRLGTVKDPLLKTSAKDGVMILQLGTAF